MRKFITQKFFIGHLLLGLSFCAVGHAAIHPSPTPQGVRVEHVVFKGLKQIPKMTAEAVLKISKGDRLAPTDLTRATRRMFKSGFFDHAKLELDGHTLRVTVAERPVISQIHFTGNDEMTTDNLKTALKNAGLVEGRIYQAAVLHRMEQAIKAQYAAMGFYQATVTSKVETLPRHRVSLTLTITEGPTAQLKSIHITGNHAFSESKLLDQFNMTTTRPWSFLTRGDVYTKANLMADLGALDNFYFNHGYLQFHVVNKQVDLDEKTGAVSVHLKVSEGPVYTIRAVKFKLSKGQWPTGCLALAKSKLTLRIGDVFSRNDLQNNTQSISSVFADKGYAKVRVNVVPNIDEKSHQVDLTFNVTPGKPIVVRRIRFQGNTETADYVLRRAMLQLEAAPFSSSLIKESQRRLSNLGYIKDVTIQPESVPGAPNQMDLVIGLKERSTLHGALMVGYGNPDGLMYGINFSQDNFLGAGDRVSLSFNKSGYSKVYSLGLTEPFYTLSGISRTLSIFSSQTTPGEVNLVNYSTDRYGAQVNFGIPVSVHDTVSVGFGYENQLIKKSSISSSTVDHFLKRYGNRFGQLSTSIGWSQSTLDRMIFPTSGLRQSVSMQLNFPAGHTGLKYYKASYAMRWFHPLTHMGWGLEFKTDLGYGAGFGGGDNPLPFFENFYAGGPESVRGYVGNTLGPKDDEGNAIGGSVQTVASVGMIVPSSFSEDVRAVLFADTGNVFAAGKFKPRELRYSAGVQFEWKAGFLPLTIVLAKALNPQPGDRTESFQFNIALGT